MKFKLFFDDGSIFELPFTELVETEVMTQMHKPKGKRRYVFGCEFSRVDKVEVV